MTRGRRLVVHLYAGLLRLVFMRTRRDRRLMRALVLTLALVGFGLVHRAG